MDDGGIRLGIVDELQARDARIAAANPRLAAKILRRPLESKPAIAPPVFHKRPVENDDDPVTAYLKGVPLANRPYATRTSVSPKQVAAAVASAWGVDVDWLKTPDRTRAHARPRFAAMDLMRVFCNSSSPIIARYYGRTDHTTALHGFKLAAKLRNEDPDFRERYDVAHDALSLIRAAGRTP